MTLGEHWRQEGRKYVLYIAHCLRLFNNSFEFNILINSYLFCFRSAAKLKHIAGLHRMLRFMNSTEQQRMQRRKMRNLLAQAHKYIISIGFWNYCATDWYLCMDNKCNESICEWGLVGANEKWKRESGSCMHFCCYSNPTNFDTSEIVNKISGTNL